MTHHRTVPAGDSEHPRSSQSQKHRSQASQDNRPRSFDTHISLPTFETGANETVILVGGSLHSTADHFFFAHSISFFILSTIEYFLVYVTTYLPTLLLITSWKILVWAFPLAWTFLSICFGDRVHSTQFNYINPRVGLLHHRACTCSAQVSCWKTFKEENRQALSGKMWVRMMIQKRCELPSAA